MNERMKGAVYIQSNILFICSIQNREENNFIVCGLKNLPAVMIMEGKLIICLRKQMLFLALVSAGCR